MIILSLKNYLLIVLKTVYFSRFDWGEGRIGEKAFFFFSNKALSSKETSQTAIFISSLLPRIEKTHLGENLKSDDVVYDEGN